MLTEKDTCDNAGMTFAVGGAGVLQVPNKVATLGDQVDTFESLIADGTISKKRVKHSVALIAISGNDYASIGAERFDPNIHAFVTNATIHDFIKNVTSEITANVQRLQEMGVTKVLVNNLPPIGCAPSQTVPNNFDECDKGGNHYASVHNSDLKKLLRAMDGVQIVDLNAAFTNIINPAKGTLYISAQLHILASSIIAS
jgi:phospholipase/lecithinase/hemolysin